MITLLPIDGKTLDQYSNTHPSGNWYHASGMAILRNSLGWQTYTLGVYDDDSMVGSVLLTGKAGRFVVALGPLLDYSNTEQVHDSFTALRSFARSKGGYRLEIFPQVVATTRDSKGDILEEFRMPGHDAILSAGFAHKGFTTEYEPTANRWVYVKDLREIHSEDELLASYRQTTRQIIKKMDRSHYSVKQLSFDELELFKKFIDISDAKYGKDIRSLSYYKSLYKSLGDTAKFLVAYYDDRPVSAAVFVYHPNEVVYFFSGNDETKRNLYGGHFLQHYVMLDAMKQGYPRYNMYGVRGVFTNNPLLVYKSGFRGFVEEYIGGYVAILNPYKQFIQKLKSGVKRILR